jgi:hypothetical protein
MLLKLIIISAFLMAFVMAALGIKILLKPTGRFPETHISRNPRMREKGIKCAQRTDIGCNSLENNEGCYSCSLRSN